MRAGWPASLILLGLPAIVPLCNAASAPDCDNRFILIEDRRQTALGCVSDPGIVAMIRAAVPLDKATLQE